MVRRGAVRLAAILTLVVGVVVGAAAPAAADDDRVSLRLPSSFTAGGSAGTVNVTVTKRTDGCVSVRTVLAVRLPGLPADQVAIQVAMDGQWRRVPVSEDGDGLVVTDQTAPDRSRLCKKRSVTVRYRVAFLAGSPGGEATLVGAAYTAGGDLIERAVGTRMVKGGAVPPPSPSASPSPQVTDEPVQTPAAAGSPTAQAASDEGGFFGIGTLAMLLGVVMVGVGIALLVMLLRRSREEGDAAPGRYRGGGHRRGGYQGGDYPGYPAGYPRGIPPAYPPARPVGGAGGDATQILPQVPPDGPSPY